MSTKVRPAGLPQVAGTTAVAGVSAVPSATASQVVDKAEVLRRLELDITRRLDGMRSGDHRTTAIGPGSERAGARRYEPGDDARRIDWSLTARSLDTYIRTTEADRELETWVVADRSASMDFGTAQREKREVVLAVAAAFGILTVRSANRFGIVVSGAGSAPPRPSANGRIAMMAALSDLYVTPRQSAAQGTGGTLAATLLQLRKTVARRGQVVVVSDFLDPSDWQHPLHALALRHQLIAVQVTDPREFTLPEVGMLTVVDPESGRELHVQTKSKDLRQKYSAAAAARHARIGQDIRASGAEHLQLSTGRDWVLDVIEFVTGRHNRRRTGDIATARRNPAHSVTAPTGSAS
ncbi:MAG TPA: DUF58 domain-containing protein [Candidatus Nanopelagicales bacterium]|jgi:uncharacterized protein (DUF58 family)